MKVLDKIGQEITEGCYIAYGHALGRCAGLRIGKVLKVESGEVEKWGRTVTATKITVWGVDDDWHDVRLLERRSTLYFPDRMVVLHKIPEKFEEYLKDITLNTKLVPCTATTDYHYSCNVCGGTGKVKP